METSDEHHVVGPESLTKTKIFCFLFGVALSLFYAIDHVGINRFRTPTTYRQTVDLIETNGERATFLQFDGIDEMNKVVMIYARYSLHRPALRLQKFNFSVQYEVTLKKSAENMRALHLYDRAIEMAPNGTKFSKVSTLRGIQYDEIDLKVVCYGLRHYFPKVEIEVFVMEDRFATRKKLCHSLFFAGSAIVLIVFLVLWNMPLSYSKASLVLLILSLASHFFWIEYRTPEWVQRVEIMTGYGARCLTKMCYVSWGYLGMPGFLLFALEMLLGVRMDVSYLTNCFDLPGLVEMYVAVCLFQVVFISIMYSRARDHKLLEGDTGFYVYLVLTVNELVMTISYRQKEPGSWFVLPNVMSDLFVWIYVGLTLDLTDPSRINEILQSHLTHHIP